MQNTHVFVGDAADLPLADASVDAIVTDPPYGLRFMGKRWDYDVPSVETFGELLRVLKPGGRLLCFAGARTMHRMWVNIEDAGFTIEDTVMWLYGQGFPKHKSKLKPAYEPICVARKGGVSELNTGACRVGTEERTYTPKGIKPGHGDSIAGYDHLVGAPWDGGGQSPKTVRGRWPANVALDEEAADLLGKPARFFYCPKASRFERNAGLDELPKQPGGSNAKGFTQDVERGVDRNRPVANPHPTVKPIKLTRWLIRLVTPEGGLVLDPFMGSGTTGCAAAMEGFRFVGCDIDEEYVRIAKHRIAHWSQEATARVA